MKSQILIGAISSGSGKTTVTLGLLRALRNRNMNVQSFKCGPDYIDTKYHQLASGKETVNLDLFLSSQQHVKNIYTKYTLTSDVAITEGVMGLFDGYDKMLGSSAQIAEVLDIPIVLVLNAKSMAYTVAPLLFGLKNFDKNLNLVGVIFNMVNTESHYRFLSDACLDVGITPLGYLPKNEEISIPSRHLGLSTNKNLLFDEFADKAAALVEKHIDVDKLLSLTLKPVKSTIITNSENKFKPLKIAVANDEAFNFFYHENIEYLRQIGTVFFFSPIEDEKLPDTDFVYLPGGYPELFAEELSGNISMKESIRLFVENNGKVLAECGGMMYLSSSITNTDGIEYSMVGIFDQKATMKNMKLKLGYRKFEYNNLKLKGHEFHYSSINSDLESITKQYTAKNMAVDTKLLRYKNVVAGYTHLYWAEINNLMDLFK